MQPGARDALYRLVRLTLRVYFFGNEALRGLTGFGAAVQKGRHDLSKVSRPRDRQLGSSTYGTICERIDESVGEAEPQPVRHRIATPWSMTDPER